MQRFAALRAVLAGVEETPAETAFAHEFARIAGALRLATWGERLELRKDLHRAVNTFCDAQVRARKEDP